MMGRQAPDGLVGVHINLLAGAAALGDKLPSETEQERAAAQATATFRQTGFGYFLEQATRPQTIGYALLDSPVALAAWMLDHDTDSYTKISRAFVDRKPVGNLTRDNVLDNVTLYWLTGTGASAARSYWENGRAAGARSGPGSSAGLRTDRVHNVPRRDLRGPAQLGSGGLPEPRVLQRGRQGRAFRRLGGAGALLRRAACRLRVCAAAVMTTAVETATGVRPFHVDFTGRQIDELRRRIVAARLPHKELVDDRSQGVQLATIEALRHYWVNEYDFQRLAQRLNALPQFTTEIDGLGIHFVHVRSPHEDALPLIVTHGWPGSVIELLDTVGPLTDPTAHGGTAEDAFHLVIPSLPGYGFSAEPAELGWYTGRTAQAWAELMRRLGYGRYVAQGGDQGAAVTDDMAHQAPEGLIGVHLNLLRSALANTNGLPARSDEERAALDAVTTFRTSGFGYFLEQSTRPQTIGYALLDSPLALAAWMLDHDTDSYDKIARAFVDGQPSGGLTRDHILDNVTLYWLTGTGASAARSYWEGGRAAALAAGTTPSPVSVPVGFTTFPGEIFRAPRSWVEQTYPSLAYFNEAARGGHFAAWEEPDLFTNELRRAFRPLR